VVGWHPHIPGFSGQANDDAQAGQLAGAVRALRATHPVKHSSIVKSVDPSPRGLSAKVLTPLKMGLTPPLQVMRSSGTTSDTMGEIALQLVDRIDRLSASVGGEE
jgi:hypothetical protein